MIINDNVISNEERAIFTLRTLYTNHGYQPYKMSKFEAYDLYVRNKDFLLSEEIITFTDTNGRLMALKPDVTLSIIKNSRERQAAVQKLYYNENIYRISKDAGTFKEIMQAGVECIGKITENDIAEVVRLAAESLQCISDDAVLDISHMGIVSAAVEALGLPAETSRHILKCIGQKNTHELRQIGMEHHVSPEQIEKICELISLYGAPEKVLPMLSKLFPDSYSREAIALLEKVVGSFYDNRLKNMLRIDFSVVNDMKYYNGIVFKGFINGIPNSVLSGGQYDGLMARMGQSDQAIGFAVYLDLLERFAIGGN